MFKKLNSIQQLAELMQQLSKLQDIHLIKILFSFTFMLKMKSISCKRIPPLSFGYDSPLPITKNFPIYFTLVQIEVNSYLMKI